MNTKKLGLLAIAGVSLLTLAGCASTPGQTQEVSGQDVSAQVLEIMEPTVEIKDMEQEEVQVQEQEQNLQAGMYVDYSPAAVQESVNDGKKVALFFHATRCPSCRSLDKDINTNISELPENSIVFKVDYDTSSDLKKKYAVTTQHTIVTIDAEMNIIEKNTGASLKKLISLLQ